MEEISARIARAQAGDKKAREELIEENLGLVHMVTKRFSGRGTQEDLFQIGVIGLLKAVDRFDLGLDVKFSTYAVPMIIGEIRRFLRDDGPIKVSRGLKEEGRRIRNARERLELRLGREATLSELAEECGRSIEEIVLALEAGERVESFESPVGASDREGRLMLGDTIADRSGEKEKLLNRILIEQLFANLKDRERELLVLRYYQNRTQTEVAGKLGISQVQVSRMEKKLLHRLRSQCV